MRDDFIYYTNLIKGDDFQEEKQQILIEPEDAFGDDEILF